MKPRAWFGATPPDLTLVARVRSPEWLYTYLRNFYVDPSRSVGVNNRVFKDVGMPHALMDLQGLQDCVGDHCDSFELVKEGTMSPEEFDGAVGDLVNFMTYIAEPFAEERKSLGKGVLLFIVFFSVFTYLAESRILERYPLNSD